MNTGEGAEQANIVTASGAEDLVKMKSECAGGPGQIRQKLKNP